MSTQISMHHSCCASTTFQRSVTSSVCTDAAMRQHVSVLHSQAHGHTLGFNSSSADWLKDYDIRFIRNAQLMVPAPLIHRFVTFQLSLGFWTADKNN